MPLFQLMVEHKDEFGKPIMVQCGDSNTNFKRLKTRLSKKSRGWVQQVNADTTKTVLVARGFSRDAMQSIKACGVDVLC